MNYSKYCNKNIGMKLGIFNPLGITRVQLQSHRNRKQVIWRSNGFNIEFSSPFSFLSFLLFSLLCSCIFREEEMMFDCNCFCLEFFF